MRETVIKQWLTNHCGLPAFTLQRLPGDASFRHYYRVNYGEHSYVLMDAATAQENCHSFVAIAKALRNMGLLAPDIIHADLNQGLLLLTDFGDTTFLKALNPTNADHLYQTALENLTILQRCRDVSGQAMPIFSMEKMWQEWEWHKEWFLIKLLDVPFISQAKHLDHCFNLVMAAAVAQPQVFMHRDFHSANLMVLPQQQIGILDFQDAFIGPITYDAVSLLRDCYIDWPELAVKKWVYFYWQKLTAMQEVQVDFEQFLRWFDWMGIERHLKALFTFARKYLRDDQASYLKHIPRTMTYLQKVSGQYPALAALHDHLMMIQPKLDEFFAERPSTCAR